MYCIVEGSAELVHEPLARVARAAGVVQRPFGVVDLDGHLPAVPPQVAVVEGGAEEVDLELPLLLLLVAEDVDPEVVVRGLAVHVQLPAVDIVLQEHVALLQGPGKRRGALARLHHRRSEQQRRRRRAHHYGKKSAPVR